MADKKVRVIACHERDDVKYTMTSNQIKELNIDIEYLTLKKIEEFHLEDGWKYRIISITNRG